MYIAKHNVHLHIECSRATRGQGDSRPRARPWDRSAPLSWQPVDCNADSLPSPFPFHGAAGPTTRMPDDSTPLDFFKQLFDDTIIDLIVTETNRSVTDSRND